MSRDCLHTDIGQIYYNAFECNRCRMVFFGIEKSDPRCSKAMHSMHTYGRGYANPDIFIDPISSIGSISQRHTSQVPVVHVDLGSMPQDVISMKTRMDELEKSLSLFVDILKNAIRT